jgi:hypothetical protein
MPEEDHEDQLRAIQDGRVYPLGRALRATYDADNHATLGNDVTGLMIDLSKIPYEADGADAALPAAAVPRARSWRDRIGDLWSGRRHPAQRG